MNATSQDSFLTLEAMIAPLSEVEPCGPDLDLSGDADFMNFMAAGEGCLPAAFYLRDPLNPERDGKPFDRAQIDFPEQYKKIAALNGRSHDLRLIVLLAKFRILDKNLNGFGEAIEALATLLEQQWDQVHPRGEDSDFILRKAALQSLDDMAPVILPLHYVPLFVHQRLGPLTYRMHLLAAGEAQPRGDEDKLDFGLIDRAFEDEIDLAELTVRRDQFNALGQAFARIKAVFVDHVGLVDAAAFPRLAPLVEAIAAMLERYVLRHDPSAGSQAAAVSESAADGSPPLADNEIANFADAAAALKAIGLYYTRFEPSNPALLLVRQAEQLIGKSFLDAIRVLVPQYVDEVTVQIGRTQVFTLPLERLSEFAHLDDEPTWDEIDDQIDDLIQEAIEPKVFMVTTRDSTLQLLSKVSAFYHQAEPSSPVAFLTERARTLTGRDFLGLLKDMLPPDTLKTREGGK
jgi:type VI secretion system protein ImpA